MSKRGLSRVFAAMAKMNANRIQTRYQLRPVFHGVDVENEYKLIQQNKSNLSASMRRKVVEAYEHSRRLAEQAVEEMAKKQEEQAQCATEE